jgi:glycosyltransferase involved in cell wall biosynthesis
MVVTTMRPHLLEQVYQNFVRQTYENKEMIIILNRADFSTSRRYSSLFEHPQIKVCFGDDSKSHGALFDQGVRLAKGELIAKIDDDDLYGPRYLSESVTSLSVSGTRITGKGARFVYIEESNELYLRCPELANSPSVRNISGSSIVAEKSLITSFGWPDLPYGVDTEFLRRILKAGEKVSSANIFSYMVLRQKSQELHTGKTNNLDIRLSSAFIAHGQHKKLILDGIFTTESLA